MRFSSRLLIPVPVIPIVLIFLLFGSCAIAPQHKGSPSSPSGGSSSSSSSSGGTVTAAAVPQKNILPTIVPSTVGQAAAQTKLSSMYAAWKAYYVTSSGCPSGDLRVQRISEPGDTTDTVSEGIGYGMLLSAYMGDQATFNGLWAYAKHWFDANGLMNWQISSNGTVIGSGAAIDADEDMALALIVADKEWGGYTSDATALINNIYNHEVMQSAPYQYYIQPGDMWNTVANPSYLAPAWYRVFAEYTGNANWTNVASASYTLMNAALPNSSVGLVPDWCTLAGSPNQTAVTSYTGYNEYWWNACRTPWRFSEDVLWYNNASAAAYCNNWITFFNNSSGGNAANIYAGYSLAGAAQVTYGNAAFTGAVACAADASSTVSSAFASSLYSTATSWTVGTGTVQGYFGDTLEVLYMLTFIGDFYNPLHNKSWSEVGSPFNSTTFAGSSATGAFSGGWAMAVSRNGTVYVLEPYGTHGPVSGYDSLQVISSSGSGGAWTGSWICTFGSGFFFNDGDIALDGSGNLWVVYSDDSGNNPSSVVTYSGTAWSAAGTFGGLSGTCGSHVAANGSTVYAGCNNASYTAGFNLAGCTSSGVTVVDATALITGFPCNLYEGIAVDTISSSLYMLWTANLANPGGPGNPTDVISKLTGVTWTTIMSANVGQGYGGNIAVGPDGTIYYAYMDTSAGTIQVMRYSSGTWVNTGPTGAQVNNLTPGSPNFWDNRQFSIKIDLYGFAYLAYLDTSANVQVLQYIAGKWFGLNPGLAGTSSIPRISLGIDGTGSAYILYNDANYGYAYKCN